MRCGLYGKLPLKRDFIAIATPRDFLAVWEPWLQGGMTASQFKLGAAWQAAFLRAPIWRFWLGAELCGTTVAGAFMPSVDEIGRYFPLTILARADAGMAIPPPELDPQDAWFRTAEELLLSALDHEAEFEAVKAAVDELAPPSDRLPSPMPMGVTRVAERTVVVPCKADSLAELLAAVRAERHARVYAGDTYWWTTGGEGYRPLAMMSQGMPDPHLFTAMLTGAFQAAAS